VELRNNAFANRIGKLGKAVQVDPIKPTLKAPGTYALKPQYDKLLSRFAFEFQVAPLQLGIDLESLKIVEAPRVVLTVGGFLLLSSTSQLNLSWFCDCNHPTHPTNIAYIELKSGRV